MAAMISGLKDGVKGLKDGVKEGLDRLKCRQSECKMCNGTGRTGVLGPQGFGQMSRECVFCTKDEDEPSATQSAPPANGRPRGFAPPTAATSAPLSNTPGGGRGFCCGYAGQDANAKPREKHVSDDLEPLPIPSYASWESSCFIPMPRSNIEPSPIADEMMHIGDASPMTPPAVTPQAQSGAPVALSSLPSSALMGGDGSPSYEGQRLDGTPHGAGRERWPNGAHFEGQFVQGRKHGTGKFLWENGSCYEGDFDSEKMSGVGVMRWQDGNTYQGQWKNNVMHGRGFFKWTDGKTYEGEYRNDVKEGRGVFKWPDGRKFDGEWHGGFQHGSGTYYTADGKRRNGTWKDGKLAQWTSPVER